MAHSPDEEFGHSLDRMLPGIAWGFLERTPPTRRGNVEAMLIGAVTPDLLEFDATTAPKLVFVQGLSTGVDGFPYQRFPDNVRFAGNVGAFAPFVAEHAIALALAAARDLRAAREKVRSGRRRPPPDQRLLYGATAVILGYGAIGREIAPRLSAFGTRVYGVSRTGSPAPGAERMFGADRLLDALRESDLVFDARPLTRLTAGTIGATELAAMRPEGVLVMVGRAGTVDEEALYRHLVDHPSFRAASDVWWDEDFPNGVFRSRWPFSELRNFVGTPHSAGAVEGAGGRGVQLALENLSRYFRDGRPAHLVDRSEYEAVSRPSPARGAPRRSGGDR
ncbi:MAG: NAD(P)-dependent oxidoreductase [Thermoplasmata archaeon]